MNGDYFVFYVNETALPLFPPLCIRFYGFLIRCMFFIIKITDVHIVHTRTFLHSHPGRSCFTLAVWLPYLLLFSFLIFLILRVGLRRLIPQEFAEKIGTLVGNIIEVFYV